jgi:hypothetical protein
MGVPHGPKRAPHVRLDGRGRSEARFSLLIPSGRPLEDLFPSGA